MTIALCERILEGRGAVRVHGGGFGGTAQAFVPLDMLDTFKKATEAALGTDCCHVVMIRPAGGVQIGDKEEQTHELPSHRRTWWATPSARD